MNIASTMLTAMDKTADPCEDFYQYACGGWMKNNPIPSGYSRWGTFELMWQKNMLAMWNAIGKLFFILCLGSHLSDFWQAVAVRNNFT